VCYEQAKASGGDLTTVCRILRTEGEGRNIFLGRGCDESDDEDEGASDEDEEWY
jgi:hypothetical protein